MPNTDLELRIRRYLRLCGVALLIIMAAGWARRTTVSIISAARDSQVSLDFAAEIASNMNADAPRMLDENIELMGTELNQRTVVYNIRLAGMDVTPAMAEAVGGAILKEHQPGIARDLCAEPQLYLLLKHGIAFRAVYHARSGQYITAFDVGLDDCG